MSTNYNKELKEDTNNTYQSQFKLQNCGFGQQFN